MNQGHTSPGEGRKPRHERLPDERLRVTRFKRVAKGAKLRDDLWLAWGTIIDGPIAGEHAEWADCRLVGQFVEEGDTEGWLVQVYETIPATGEVQVGGNTIIKLEDGRTAVEAEFLQFASDTFTSGTVGTTTAPGDSSAFMLKAEQTNDGCLRRIKRTYVYAGQIQQSDDTKNNGKLLIRTLVYVKTEPSTPSGYVLFRTASNPVNGIPVYTYSFAKGDGEITRELDYGQSTDQGTIGITRLTITHLTASSVGSDPTSASGYAKVSERKHDDDGYRIWTIVYAKGTGLVVDEVTVRSMGALNIYHRVALGSAPSAPSDTLSGTVTLFDSGTRNDNGWVVYDYRWAEGNGQTGVSLQARPDGSLVYVVTELDVSQITPAYPGSGTAYLVDLDQNVAEGYWVNRATYIKPPATVTYNKQIQFTMPGLASFTSDELTLSPPTTRTLLASVEVSYSTTQLSDTPFSVTHYASFRESYTPTATGIPVSSQRGLGGYLAGATSVSGTDDTYNGVLCDEFAAVLVSSTPSSRPTGATVLHVDNEDYLVATDGTKVFRRTKISYTFS